MDPYFKFTKISGPIVNAFYSATLAFLISVPESLPLFFPAAQLPISVNYI